MYIYIVKLFVDVEIFIHCIRLYKSFLTEAIMEGENVQLEEINIDKS